MAVKKNTYVSAELDWAEQQLSSWKEYVDANPLHLLKDRIKIYEKNEERKRANKADLDSSFINRLAADSEEQLRYNNLINSIADYKDYNEYKLKTSFRYKLLKFFKLTK